MTKVNTMYSSHVLLQLPTLVLVNPRCGYFGHAKYTHVGILCPPHSLPFAHSALVCIPMTPPAKPNSHGAATSRQHLRNSVRTCGSRAAMPGLPGPKQPHQVHLRINGGAQPLAARCQDFNMETDFVTESSRGLTCLLVRHAVKKY